MYDDDDDFDDYDDDFELDDDELAPRYTKDPEGNLVTFNIEILNPGVACSTIVVYNNHTFSTNMTTNVKRFRDLFTTWDRMGGRYRIEQHAFLFASTIENNMKSAERFFKAMGFQSIGPVYNAKNSTNVTHWIMPIKEFIQNLETAEKDFAEAEAKALREEEDSLQIVIDSKYRRLVEEVKSLESQLAHFNNLLKTLYRKEDKGRASMIAWRDNIQKNLEKSQELLNAHMAKRHKLWVSRKRKEEEKAAKEKEAA